MPSSRRSVVCLLLSLMLVCLCGCTETPVVQDTDKLGANDFAKDAIQWLYNNGIISQPELQQFNAGMPITPSDFSQWLQRAELSTSTFGTAGSMVTCKDFAEYAVSLLNMSSIASRYGGVDVCQTFKLLPEDMKLTSDAAMTRAQAAYFLCSLKSVLKNKAEGLYAFYAISSYDQRDMIEQLSGVSMGWSRFEVTEDSVYLNTSTDNDNEYSMPNSSEEIIELAESHNVPYNLMIAVGVGTVNGMQKAEHLLNTPSLRDKAMTELLDVAQNGAKTKNGGRIHFKGITLDLECMAGAEVREAYNEFVKELRNKLPANYNLMICVHPARSNGRSYYNGYDFKVLGDNSDGLIVMAHDYYTKSLSEEEQLIGAVNTPPAPIYELYYAIKYATDPTTGTDPKKVWLAVSFDSVQWQLDGGRVKNATPYHPTYDAIAARLPSATVTHGDSGNPKAVWDADGLSNVMFYEDTYSVMQKQALADAFDIAGLSLWRLGCVPDFGADIELDVWQSLINRNK